MKLSIDRKHYERAEKLLVWNTLKDVLNGKVIPNWIGESECFWYQRDINTDSKQFIVVDPIRRIKKRKHSIMKSWQRLFLIQLGNLLLLMTFHLIRSAISRTNIQFNLV